MLVPRHHSRFHPPRRVLPILPKTRLQRYKSAATASCVHHLRYRAACSVLGHLLVRTAGRNGLSMWEVIWSVIARMVRHAWMLHHGDLIRSCVTIWSPRGWWKLILEVDIGLEMVSPRDRWTLRVSRDKLRLLNSLHARILPKIR
jgi:hypothetical protein